jgi:hypothetical protein
MLQSARPDSVRTLLVLLHLLAAKAERIGQLCLAYREHHPPHAHPAANVHVNGVWILDGRHRPSPSMKEIPCRNARAFRGEAACQRQLSATFLLGCIKRGRMKFALGSADGLRTWPPALNAIR